MQNSVVSIKILQLYSYRVSLSDEPKRHTVPAADGGELSVEEMYKRTLQEVGSLREQLGGWVVNVSAQSCGLTGLCGFCICITLGWY